MRLLLLLYMAVPAAAQAAPPRLEMSLAQAEKAALEHSPLVKAAQSNLAAALAQAEVQLSQLVPRVTADGSYSYQTAVPKVSLTPGAPAVPFGDHNNYSLGGTLTYTLWDNGSLLKSWRSQKALATSVEAQRDLVRRQILLMTRLDYFQVQLALEQVRSLADSLKLSEAQYGDISKRFRVGSASRIDWLSAHQQVLDRRRDLRSAQADAAAALRALFARTGEGQGVDVSAALDARIEAPLPAGLSSATVVVSLQPLEAIETALAPAGAGSVDDAYPQLLVYGRQAEAQRLSAASLDASRWPRLNLSYKSDYLYPNMPLLSAVWQNTAGVSASFPIFELGRTRSQVEAARAQSEANLGLRDSALDELQRDYAKARDQLSALKDEEAIERESVDETAEIAKLRYASYREGGSTILDVETANVNAVQARVAAARTRTQILIQLATLASLSRSAHE